MAKLIKANGEVSEIEPANGRYFTLKEMQTAVAGYVEVVQLRDGRLMVVNEDGHGLGLPWNAQATDLYRNSAIAGDVIVCKPNQIR